jgi:ABC-2 type transport system permease protein
VTELSGLLWVEFRKAWRSRMPLWTCLGSLFMPLGIAFLIFVSRNPGISQQLGLVSAKADLVAYSATDWPAYLGLSGMVIAAGGYFFYVITISWIFGREFTDGTLKDMLAVPVPRSSILLAKFIVFAVWAAGLGLVSVTLSLVMGAVIHLPGASASVFGQGSALLLVTACLVILVVLPFAFFSSIGRGYLLPLGVAVLMIMMANVVGLAGWGEYFPWAVPGLFAQGKSTLPPESFGIVLLTGLAGILATWLWWRKADQPR